MVKNIVLISFMKPNNLKKKINRKFFKVERHVVSPVIKTTFHTCAYSKMCIFDKSYFIASDNVVILIENSSFLGMLNFYYS